MATDRTDEHRRLEHRLHALGWSCRWAAVSGSWRCSEGAFGRTYFVHGGTEVEVLRELVKRLEREQDEAGPSSPGR
jgi:hypothetical protein